MFRHLRDAGTVAQATFHIALVALMQWPLLFSPAVHVISLTVTKLDNVQDMSHCSDLDLIEQKTRVNSDNGFIFKEINQN